MTTMQVLQDHELFRGLDSEELLLLQTFTTAVAVERGSAIFTEGEPARFLYAIRQGKVGLEMAVPKPDGGYTRRMMVTILGPHDVFGWSALVEPHTFTLSARALEQCDLVKVEGRALREALHIYREVGFVVMSNLAEILAKRLAQTRQALVYERGWAMVG
jgi:CRP-like cAMP-binding protein